MRRVFLALIFGPVGVLSQTAQPSFAHEHGSGLLEITVSGAALNLSLIVPGKDILGFERAAENDQDRALVAGAISDLSKPLELFVMSNEAGCFAASANVTLAGEGLGQTTPGADDGTDRRSDAHTEFHASYMIQCQNIDALETIEFDYFDRFESAKNLNVSIGSTGEVRELAVDRSQPSLNVSEIF